MFVKIATVGNGTTEIAIEDGATVAEALDEAGIALATGQQVTVNGTAAVGATVITAPAHIGFATVMISGTVKGGAGILVKIARPGAASIEVCIEDGQTVSQAAAIAGVDLRGKNITVNGVPATATTPVTQPSAVVMVSGDVKGGK